MEMRRSRVLERLRQGDAVACYKTNLSDARVVEIAALFGFDCVWSDMEHTANDWAVVERHVWAAKTQNTDVMVRIARGSYSDYIRPFELDAAGIMVPHVMNRQDAEAVVRRTRYMPLGRRAIDAGNADGRYFNLDFAQYTQQANEQRFVVVQIEDHEALTELEGIAAVPGIDLLFFGPGDFSHSLGVPGQWDHPAVKEARQRVAAAAVQAGKWAGTVGSPDNLAELLALGYRFVVLGADVSAISQQCRTLVESARAIAAQTRAAAGTEP
jgi:4-hydroxy-2-oxoheptanedioate aldolase